MSIDLGKKRIVVTGGAGFLGSYVTERLEWSNLQAFKCAGYALVRFTSIDDAVVQTWRAAGLRRRYM